MSSSELFRRPRTAPVSSRRYVLAILTLVFTLNYVDRNLVILLLEPIRRDLHLSDTQLGFVTGIAFGLFYATLGLPIARWADRANRATITSAAIGLWGTTVMSCLLVSTFPQLLAARIAAAIGESGCMPPTYSLIGDYFSAPAERTRAMAIYTLAGPLASLISFSIGGWLNELYGWRVTFALMGIPGLMVAVLVKLTIADPRTSRDIASPHPRGSVRDVLRILWCRRSLRHLNAAYILLITMALGLAPWYAAFMMRSHGMRTGELGLWLSFVFGFGGMAGTLLGGYLCARWFVANERGQMRLCALTVAALVPSFVLFLLLPNKYQALLVLLPLNVVFCFFLGPTYALMQRLVADDIRATALAVIMLLSNIIGMGIGPQLVGILSDLLRPRLGGDSLRYAMLAMSLVAIWSAYHFWLASRSVESDLRSLALQNEPHTPWSAPAQA